jgi:hypothetical protein
MKIHFFAKTSIFCLVIILQANAGYSTTYYSSSSGSGSTCSSGSPCSLTTGIGRLSASGGDTLTLADGTYTSSISSIPNGRAGFYNIIKASNDGGAVITGALGIVNTTQYIQFEGLKWKYTEDKMIEGSHLKFLRCAFEGGGTSGYGVNTGVGTNNYPNATNYILFEDCWFYGIGGRYNLQLYLVDHIIVRRCVFRHDGGYGPNSGNPEAALTVYNSQYVEIQNCIVIDSNLGNYVYFDQAFYIIYNSASAESTEHISVLGSMAINNEANAFRWDGSSTTITTDTFTNNVGIGYGTSGAYALVNGSSKVNLSCSVTQCGFKTFTYGAGHWGPGTPSVSNSFFASISSTLYNGWSNSGNSTTPGSTWLYPPRVESGTVGPTIVKKIGISGTLYGDPGYNITTSDNLWPWPNEARIKNDMASVSARGFASGASRDGSAQSLTKYIWEYLGNTIPSDIYSATTLQAPKNFHIVGS